jgi:predicted RNase H-like HicB family nuclease
MKKIKVTIEKTNSGYSAGADPYPVYTAGDSFKEIKANIVEALNLYFEHNGEPPIDEDQIKLTPK